MKNTSASYHQERMWFIDSFERGYLYENGPVYHNVPFIIKTRTEINKNVLKKAIRHVIGAHDVYSTRLTLNENKPVQQIFSIDDIRIHTKTVKNFNLAKLLEKSQETFKFVDEHLFRFHLWKISGYTIFWGVFHHAITDPYSVRLFISEVMETYEQLAEKENLPELKKEIVSYRKFSEWQRNLPEKSTNPALFYWRRKLNNGILEKLSVPTDAEREKVHIYHPQHTSFVFDQDIKNKALQFCKEHDITLRSLFLSCYSMLLSKLSFAEKIVIGTMLDNRSQKELEHTAGSVANLVPIYNDISKSESFVDFCKAVALNLKEAEKYHYYPFDKLTNDLKPEIDMSRTVLFDALFTYHKEFKPGNPNYEVIETGYGYGKYDFHLWIEEGVTSIKGNFISNQKYYTKNTAGHIEMLFQRLIEQVVSATTIEWKDIELVQEKEKNYILHEFNNTKATYPQTATITSLIDKSIKKYPDNTALDFHKQRLTYKELGSKVDELTKYLICKGVRPGNHVALLMDKSEKVVITFLAILKAGAVYVPLDPEYPAYRLNYILDNCKPVALLIGKDIVVEGLTPDATKYLVLRPQEEDLSIPKDILIPENSIIPSSPAYIIYTSGTTGNPKGVIVTHQNVVRLMVNNKIKFNFNEKDVWTMFHSHCFDFSVWEMYGPLLYGGKLIVIDKSTSRDPFLYSEILEKQKVTVLNQTPSSFYTLSAVLLKNKTRLSLRYVVFGGEKLSFHKLADFNKHFPKVELINMYGITETTVHTTFKKIGMKEFESKKSIIGHPIPTTTCYVLDRHKKLVPLGGVGELYVGGLGVATGYVDPVLTEQRFIPNPYNPSEKLYKSGDLVSLLPDGNLEYFWRIDNQVQLKGFRIELNEIEFHANAYTSVQNAFACIRKDPHNEDNIYLYFTSTSAIEPALLRSHLTAFIPKYMQPAYLIQVAEIPLTLNGKVDITKLPLQEERKREKMDEKHLQPTQIKILAICKEVLGHDNISIEDDFFAYGGDSLKAVSLINKIEEAFGFRFHVSEIFNCPTLNAIAAEIDKHTGEFKTEKITPVEQKEMYDITPAQFGIWYVCQMSKIASASYNITGAVMIEGEFNAELMEKSVSLLASRHEILRTVFRIFDTGVKQKIIPETEFQVPFMKEQVNLQDYNNDLAVFISRILQAEKIHAFDLEKGPLFKIRHMQLENQRCMILLNIHHIICDGWSIGIFVKQLFKCYDNLKFNKDYELPKLSLQFKDYTYWIKNEVTKNEEKHIAYWEKLLLPVPPPLAFKNARQNGVKQYKGNSVAILTKQTIVAKVKEQVRNFKTTEYVFYGTIAAILLSEHTGNMDVVMLSPFSTRPDVAFENQIGLYLNSVPLRVKIKEEATFKELIEEVKQTTLSNFNHHLFPFVNIVSCIKKTEPDFNPAIFNIMFTFQNQDMGGSTLESKSDLRISYVGQKSETAKFDINFNLTAGDRLSIQIEYNTALFTEEEMRKFVSRYQELIYRFAENPTLQIKEKSSVMSLVEA